MNRYINNTDFTHSQNTKVGLLLVNLGTPAAPTPAALRKYLAEFLWDPRVVEIPRPVWWLILHGIILRTRPRRSAKAYAEVWTEQGSPLLTHTEAITQALKERFAGQSSYITEFAMRYGEPSIKQALQSMQKQGVDRLLVLPIYPQYSATTTASVFDEVCSVLQRCRYWPELRLINHYHDDVGYITALASSIKRFWQENGRGQKLLMSFHGIPKRNLLLGDPYYCHCQKTARLLAVELGLSDDEFAVTFQSRFGKAEWLQPYTDQTLKALPTDGIKEVDVVCPGFAADCLETLEEIAVENRHYFMEAGGKQYRYIPALNSEAEHINALYDLLQLHLQGWSRADEDSAARVQRAQALGADA